MRDVALAGRVDGSIDDKAGQMSAAVDEVRVVVEVAIAWARSELDMGEGLEFIAVDNDVVHTLELVTVVDKSSEELVGHLATNLVSLALLHHLGEHLHAVLDHEGCSSPLCLPVCSALKADEAFAVDQL